MSKIYIVLCVSLCVGVAYSATGVISKQEVPAKYAGQPGCYGPDHDVMLEEGVPYRPVDGKTCMEYTCQSDGTIQIFTCGVAVAKGCKPTRDYTKPYPKCCDNFDHCVPQSTPASDDA